MTPTDAQYREAAWCEAVVNLVPPGIAIEASLRSKTGKQFDNNISAAIQASEWLGRIIKQR